MECKEIVMPFTYLSSSCIGCPVTHFWWTLVIKAANLLLGNSDVFAVESCSAGRRRDERADGEQICLAESSGRVYVDDNRNPEGGEHGGRNGCLRNHI